MTSRCRREAGHAQPRKVIESLTALEALFDARGLGMAAIGTEPATPAIKGGPAPNGHAAVVASLVARPATHGHGHHRGAVPAPLISAENTILEWLAHPKGCVILKALMAQAPGDPEVVLRMIEGMPMSKLVAVSGGALTQTRVDQMVAEANL